METIKKQSKILKNEMYLYSECGKYYKFFRLRSEKGFTDCRGLKQRKVWKDSNGIQFENKEEIKLELFKLQNKYKGVLFTDAIQMLNTAIKKERK